MACGLGRLDVGLRPAPRSSAISVSAPALLAHAGSASAAWRASSMMRPASVLASASLAPVLLQHLLDLGLGRLGLVEVALDPLGAVLHALLDRREAELPQRTNRTQNAEGAPDDLVGLGQDRARRLLAVVDRARPPRGCRCTPRPRGRLVLSLAACGRPGPRRRGRRERARGPTTRPGEQIALRT